MEQACLLEDSGAEVAGAALTGAAATKLWERHKDKKEHERDVAADEYHDRSRNYSRSPSRSRSRARSVASRDPAANDELGLVTYGNTPLSPNGDYESTSMERRHIRHRSPSSDPGTGRQRSRSKLRKAAAGVLGAGAAAIGIKKYHDRHESKERERSRERSRDRERSRRERRHPPQHSKPAPPCKVFMPVNVADRRTRT